MKEEVLKRLLNNNQITKEEYKELGGEMLTIQNIINSFEYKEDSNVGFNLQECINLMEHINVTWKKKRKYEIPTKSDLNKTLNYLIEKCLLEACDEILKEPNKEHYAGFISVEGLDVSAHYRPETKTEKLMIGDLVLWKDNIVKVEAITFNKATIYDFNEEKGELECEVEVAKLEPIPLTKEILEKMGLKREKFYIDDELKYLWEITDKFYLKEDYSYYGNKFTFCKIDLYFDFEKGTQIIDICPIDYVHELQHAFKLCGIKQEIEV